MELSQALNLPDAPNMDNLPANNMTDKAEREGLAIYNSMTQGPSYGRHNRKYEDDILNPREGYHYH